MTSSHKSGVRLNNIDPVLLHWRNAASVHEAKPKVG
jgi:hypothetical protein